LFAQINILHHISHIGLYLQFIKKKENLKDETQTKKKMICNTLKIIFVLDN